MSYISIRTHHIDLKINTETGKKKIETLSWVSALKKKVRETKWDCFSKFCFREIGLSFVKERIFILNEMRIRLRAGKNSDDQKWIQLFFFFCSRNERGGREETVK